MKNLTRKKKTRQWKKSIVRKIAYDTTKYSSKTIFSILKLVLMMVIVISFVLGGILLGFMAACINSAPIITDAQLVIDDRTSFIYDNDMNVITELHGSENINRIFVSYDQIPDNLKNAFIAIEDERFEKHNGIDLKRISSAVAGLLLPGLSSHGGSTITQQLVKHVTGDWQESYVRKVQEWWRALQLERKLDKWQILELYLNLIYMGEGAYGVQAASLVYFDKNVWDLSLAECASLAGITNSPSDYDPLYYDSRKENITRQHTILEKMLLLESISQEEYENAIKEKLKFNLSYHEDIKNKPVYQQSYFIDQVVLDVKRALMNTLDISENQALDMIYSKGIKIETTQDTELQKAMAKVFSDPENFPVKSDLHAQAAMVILDPWTGQVKAMYGGYGEKKGNTFNRATQMKRQAGSSFKPIAVYGPALDRGYLTAGSVIDDAPAYFDTEEPDEIYPRNYDSDGYEGLATVRKSIQSSINTVAAKAWLLIPDVSLLYLKRVGLDRDEERYISMALGGLYEGVSPLDMAAAFQPFVNKGLYYKPVTFTRVLDSNGKEILRNVSLSNLVYEDERTPYILTDMMKDVVNKGTAYPYGIIENAKGDVIPTAGKTGTSSDYYDKWFIGYSRYYVGATWYGYDLNTKLVKEEYRVAQDLWNKVMTIAHADKEVIDFERPEGIVEIVIDGYTGMLPSELSSQDPRGSKIITELYISGTEPYTIDNLHIEVTLCIDSLDEFNRATLALPWCPEESVVTKVKIDKPEKFKLHENEDGTFENKNRANFPDDFVYEAVTEYCTVHQMPMDWEGPIPEGYLEQLLEMGIVFEDVVTETQTDVVVTETQTDDDVTETQTNEDTTETQTNEDTTETQTNEDTTETQTN